MYLLRVLERGASCEECSLAPPQISWSRPLALVVILAPHVLLQLLLGLRKVVLHYVQEAVVRLLRHARVLYDERPVAYERTGSLAEGWSALPCALQRHRLGRTLSASARAAGEAGAWRNTSRSTMGRVKSLMAERGAEGGAGREEERRLDVQASSPASPAALPALV